MSDEREQPESTEQPEEESRGTMFLMLCFLGVIALMWGWMYFTLWQQGS